MKLTEVVEMLNGMDIPVAYYQWKENSAPSLPYILYYYPSNNDESADGINWATINQLNIELYTSNKNFKLEQQLEDILKQNEFYFMKSEQYIDDEKMYEVLYEMEVVIDG